MSRAQNTPQPRSAGFTACRKGFKPDVVITGQMGLYEIRFVTEGGTAWFQQHLEYHGRTWHGDALICDSSRMCRDIVAGMDRDGLAVELNGQDMKGFGS